MATRDQQSSSRLASLLASRPALLAFLGVNALAQLGVYVRHEARLQDIVLAAPDAVARISFLAWIAALVGALALTLASLGWLEARLWQRRGAWSLVAPLCVVLQTVALVAVVADTRLFETMGLHLYDDVVLHAAAHPGADRELHLGGRSSLSLLGFGAATLLGQALLYALCRAVTGRLRGAHRASLGLATAGLLAAASVGGVAVAGGLSGRVAPSAADYLAAAPWYQRALGHDPFTPVAGEVQYPPQAPLDWRPARRPDVLFVLVESLRGDHLTPELMPHASAYAARHGCMVSPRHYAGGHTTEYGAFGLLYGLYGYHYEPFSRDRVASWPLRLLGDAGYRLAGASASALRDWNHGRFIFDGVFDDYREYLDAPAEVGDAQVVEHLVAARRERGGPMFAFAFFNSTHHNYLYPPQFEIDTPVIARDYDHFMGDDRLEAQREPIVNRYRNSVRWVDHLFGQLVEEYREANGGRAPIVVLTGDHGEEFWEQGLLGHGAPRFNEERVRVPLIVCLPEHAGPAAPALSPTAHVDLWPTVLDHLGLAQSGAWLDGESLLGPARERERAVWVGGLDFPWDTATGAFIDGTHKFWMRLCPGEALCLEPWYVTDLSDREVPIGTRREALRGYVDAFLGRFERFVRIAR